MDIPFTKMHGLGNDFVVLENPPTLSGALIRAMADRRTGIGFDQALIIEPKRRPDSDFYYRIFNADGGEVEQCGNGARCLAYWHSRQVKQFNHLWRMDSPAGVMLGTSDESGHARVAMGIPTFAPAAIPFVADVEQASYAIDIGTETLHLSVASMGNPHGVLWVDDVATAPVATVGALLESHPRFPQRANIGFMQLIDRHHIKLRVYERGVGETQACGTGACAAVAIGRRLGKLADSVTVELPGGQVIIDWPDTHQTLWLSGPATWVFHGFWRT